jgi:N6-L-threonylcarbamoyladenine synthase
MLTHKNFDFSFSGLKTSVLYLTKGKKITGKKLNNIAASFQQAVADVLVTKTVKAAEHYKVKSVFLAGGVAANKPLREQLQRAIQNEQPKTKFYTPPLWLCTDNATMIALAGYFRARRKHFTDWRKLVADPNWELV